MQDNIEAKGLTQAAAEQRLATDGPNEVQEPAFNFTKAILSRLWEPSAWILEAALILEIVLGKGIQAAFIVIMLLFAAVNGAIQSRRASIVLHSLAHDLTPTAAVKRDGQWAKLPAKKLVVGDLISLRQGDIVPADVKLLSAALEIDESSITGESKTITHHPGTTAFAGTEIVTGSALARVTATGAASRSGKTISLINQSSAPGHLEKLLGKVIGYLAAVDSILAVILISAAFIRHESLIAMLPFLAMLFIATIPIAMPSSFAVANSVEAKVLSKHNVLVSDLTGIQEAANTNLLLVDKTGTITTNKPEVVAFYNLSQLADQNVMQLAASATDQRNASVIDAAVVNHARSQDVTPLAQANFIPFDSTTGYAQTNVTTASGIKMLRLGALKKLTTVTTNKPELPNIDYTAGRTVALAVDDQLVALFILQDQPRADSAAALKKIQARGVKTIMLTGDKQETAAAVAKSVGLSGKVVSYANLNADTDVATLAGIADVVPENKLAIAKRLQSAGYIVGMTGDGVNDAPALKQADVGIAVANARDLAKRSARMVLLTPGLTPIIAILDSGHRVYQRMLTWTITKLARTAELTMLLTLGYLFLRFIPLALNAMILIAILNDCVTLVLGTDNTTITKRPENWSIRKLGKIAGLLAGGWTAVGYGWLLWLNNIGLTNGQVSTGLYVYLIFSAMLTIIMTRTKKVFWRSAPSRAVAIAITGNCVLTVILALTGWGVAAISPTFIALAVVLVLATGIILTGIKTVVRL
ncbi:HAD-IC family P-type ATPase [Lacticaseibacillus zhaodongensis]|uniref:HAD-IC family P-type ATPase n=1 Tax=Lacticaseibacillus zhaodongensis TaxID=2668065 RepID=UPI0012D2A72F|nr:HAD-IC family P-type ATPase [Lacticaseibacillus zhaodongensis]